MNTIMKLYQYLRPDLSQLLDMELLVLQQVLKVSTISYNQDLPRRLYYNLEKGGYISTADKEVSNYSEIMFTDSAYVGDYKVSPIGFTSTSFNIFLSEVPDDKDYHMHQLNVTYFHMIQVLLMLVDQFLKLILFQVAVIMKEYLFLQE